MKGELETGNTIETPFSVNSVRARSLQASSKGSLEKYGDRGGTLNSLPLDHNLRYVK